MRILDEEKDLYDSITESSRCQSPRPCAVREHRISNERGTYVINPGISGKVALVTGGGYRMHQ